MNWEAIKITLFRILTKKRAEWNCQIYSRSEM